jgi:hypothetical protein
LFNRIFSSRNRQPGYINSFYSRTLLKLSPISFKKSEPLPRFNPEYLQAMQKISNLQPHQI